MNAFQMIFVPLCAALAVLVVLRGLRERSAVRQTLFWSVIWTAAAVAIGFPDSVSVAAKWLGIGRGADLVFYAAVLTGVAACLYFYQRCRRLEYAVYRTRAPRGDSAGLSRQPLRSQLAGIRNASHRRAGASDDRSLLEQEQRTCGTDGRQ